MDEILYEQGLTERQAVVCSKSLRVALNTIKLPHLNSKVVIEQYPRGYALRAVNNPTQDEVNLIKGICTGVLLGLHYAK